jgi:phage N-6-adenine-methyltransferase
MSKRKHKKEITQAASDSPIVTTRKGIGGHTSPNRGATDSWITPKETVDALGPFDLDPCACSPQPWKCAENHYTIEQDGLAQLWEGRIWLNPPYSEVWGWLDKLADHGRGTALIFARTEVKGFVEQVWQKASAIMFLHGRLFFHHPDGTRAKGNSGGPSCLVAYGRDDAQRLRESGLSGSIVSGWDSSW